MLEIYHKNYSMEIVVGNSRKKTHYVNPVIPHYVSPQMLILYQSV